MNSGSLYPLEQEFLNCDLCNLCEKRVGYAHFGMGHPDGNILVVIPNPVIHNEAPNPDPELYDNNPYQDGTLERVEFRKIINAAHIDQTQVYLIPSVMCPPGKDVRLQEDHIDACRPRLQRTIETFNPRVLVLCGPQSYYAFYKKVPGDQKYGKIYDKEGKTVYYTWSLHAFLQQRIKVGKDHSDIIALSWEILSHWQEIKKISES